MMKGRNVRQLCGLILLALILLGCTVAEPDTVDLPVLATFTLPPTPLITPSVEPVQSTAVPDDTPEVMKEEVVGGETAVATLFVVPSEPAAINTPTGAPSDAAAACGPPPGWMIYTVQVNDTLFSLARRTNTSVAQIQQANCLADTLIFAGQHLYLPFVPPPIPTVTERPSPEATEENPAAPSATPEDTPIPTPETPDAPGPGDPRLSIEPFDGPIGTTYTIIATDFIPGETVTITIATMAANDVIFTEAIIVDAVGSGSVQFTSIAGNPVGLYTVTGEGDSGRVADGNMAITD